MTPEHAIQNGIRLALGKAGWLCFRCNVGTVRTADGGFFSTGLPNGFPDLIAFGPSGQLLLIECKSAKGRLREDQKAFRAEIERRGFAYVIARTPEDALRACERAGQRAP